MTHKAEMMRDEWSLRKRTSDSEELQTRMIILYYTWPRWESMAPKKPWMLNKESEWRKSFWRTGKVGGDTNDKPGDIGLMRGDQ